MVAGLLNLSSPTTRAEWVAQARRLRAMLRKRPADDGIRNGLLYAERVIAELDNEERRRHTAEASLKEPE
jgi:hypothetical protein